MSRTLLEIIKEDAGPTGVMQADYGEDCTYVSVTDAGSTTSLAIKAVWTYDQMRDDEDGNKIRERATVFLTGDSTTGIQDPSVRDYITHRSYRWNVTRVYNSGPDKCNHTLEVERLVQHVAHMPGARRGS